MIDKTCDNQSHDLMLIIGTNKCSLSPRTQEFRPGRPPVNMTEFTELTVWQNIRNFFQIRIVKIALTFLGCVTTLALVITLATSSPYSQQSGARSPFVLQLSPLTSDGEPHITDPDELTILGPTFFAEEETAVDETVPSTSNRTATVRISGQGNVRGIILKSRKGRDYNAFYKIPYARPPVGNLRFEPPRSPRRWFGIRDASVPGKQCVQKEKYAPIVISTGEEDCLYLNIYTPKLPENRRDRPNLPVMLYIHGGGMYGNATRYAATYFADENVILVTFEFRLGVLGGFTTGSDKYPGNLGNRDIIAALKWVQKNIERFGGDPKRVTIFGNSSGSSRVHALLLSKMSQGLYHRAIMQSGTALIRDLIVPDAVPHSQNFTEEVGCGRYWGNERRLLDCLRDLDADKIVLSQSQFAFGGLAVDTVPEDADESDIFLADAPWNLVQAGQMIPVPLMTGVMSKEYAHAALPYLSEDVDLEANFENLFPEIMGIPDDENFTIATRFREVYFGDKEINNDTRDAVVDLFSDKFPHAARVSGLFHAANTNQSVYFYTLSKEVAKSYADSFRKVYPPPYGASHADELQLLFPYDDYPLIPVDSPWFNISEAMIRMWVSFAAEGRPISSTVEWPPIDLTDDGMKWFQLDDEFKVTEPFTERMKLWDDYTDELYSLNLPQ